MNEKKNTAILKEAYAHWDENKEQAFQHWMDLLSDDVNFRSLADGHEGMEFTRKCNCKSEVRKYFVELARDWAMISFKMTEFIAQGDRVVAIGSCKWKYIKTGKEVETPKVDIFTMRNSKIVDFMEMYDTARVIACTRE